MTLMRVSLVGTELSSTQKETLATAFESWNLYEASDKCLRHMEREIIRRKEKKVHNLKNL